MKKLTLSVAAAMMFATSVFAQPIHDNAVVPVAVTLNSILRLTVASGGNQEFVFTNIDAYKVGMYGTSYETDMNVSASQNWDLEYMAEDATFVGDNSTLALDNVGLWITNNAGANDVENTNTMSISSGASVSAKAIIPTNAYQSLIEHVGATSATGNGGDNGDNAFTIHWACGTGFGDMTDGSFIDQDYETGRYATNIHFLLKNAD